MDADRDFLAIGAGPGGLAAAEGSMVAALVFTRLAELGVTV
jgi:hypothetical protein